MVQSVETTEHAVKSPPGMQELPLAGSLFAFQKDRLALFTRVAKECGDIGRIHFGPFPLVVVSSSELAQEVLVRRAADFGTGEYFVKVFAQVLGNGLFISEGDFWRKQRKLMAPSFQPRHIGSYAESMVHYGEMLQQRWLDREIVDIGQEMTHVTMSIVGKVLFDTDVFSEYDELGKAMTIVLEHPNYMLSHVFPIPFNWPVPRHLRTKHATEVLDERIGKMIADRQASSEERNDFLSVLLNAQDEDGNRMDDKQVRDEALTLFGAGHETTATTLTWAWYLLARHPEEYQKMEEEIDGVLEGRSPTIADLPRLPYTLKVLKEAMRLYPPAYAISRFALKDMELGGYEVKKDTVVTIPLWVIHRRPDYFTDPEKFEPERFTPEMEKQLPKYAYLPFGAGPRVCIGNHFAMMEGHLLLATLAQRAHFELLPGQEDIEPDAAKTITIRPGRGIKMRVRRK